MYIWVLVLFLEWLLSCYSPIFIKIFAPVHIMTFIPVRDRAIVNDRRIVSEPAWDTLIKPDRHFDDLVILNPELIPCVLICERLRNIDQELCHVIHDVVFSHLLEIDQHDSRVIICVTVKIKLWVSCLIFRNSSDPFVCQVCFPQRIKAVTNDCVNVQMNDLVDSREVFRIKNF